MSPQTTSIGGSGLDPLVDYEIDGEAELLESLAAFKDSTTTIVVEIAYVQIAGATPAAAFYAGAVRSVFGQGIAIGIVSVRNIAGTSIPSQHSFGNACDVMVTGSLHRDVAYWTDANRGPLSIAHLLADPYFPSPLGDHYTHVHADFNPQYPL